MKDILSLQKITIEDENLEVQCGINSYNSFSWCSSLSFYQC